MLHKRDNRYGGWRWNRWLPTLLFVLNVLLLAGCVRDEVDYVPDPNNPLPSDIPAGSVMLHVGLPQPVTQEIGTRAAATDFNEFRDLNIVIADGSADGAKILSCVYFRPGDMQDGESVVGGDDLVVYKKLLGQGENAFSVHFSKKWLDYMEISSDNVFFLVGNYGRALEYGEMADVGALRRLQDRSAAGVEGWVNTPCMLFGESADNGTHDHADGTQGRSLRVEMKRTAAMITVKIDGSGLNRNIVITPLEISLHNVPTGCPLGVPNTVATTGAPDYVPVEASAVAAKGAYKTDHDLQWDAIVGQATLDGGYSGIDGSTVVGGHYTDAPGTVDRPDYSNPNVHPLFMYENVHGAGFGETANVTERTKRPRGVEATQGAIAAATRSCSYLEVKAQYQRFDDNGNVVLGGNVAFRVFLGKDVLSDFDVERNTYYRFTLMLQGNAVTEGGQIDADGMLVANPGDATWRVNTNLSEMMIVGDADIIVGGNGEMVEIEFASAVTKQMIIQFQDENGNPTDYYPWAEPFVFVEESSKQKHQWYALNEFNGNFQTLQNAAGNYEVYFYVQPMIRDVTWNNKGENEHVRTVTFRIAQKSGDVYTDWITVTQYEPIQLVITDSSPEEVRRYVTEQLKATLPATIYLDRIDREPRPWGFDGVTINDNRNTGFENAYHLIDPEDPTDPVCAAHREESRRYLPFGFAYREDNGILDYNKGSSMMHAAFMNSAQQWIAPQTPNGRDQLNGVSTAEIAARTTLPPRPGTDPNQNPDLCFAWTVPSIAEWQLIEKMHNAMPGGVIDPAYPVMPAFMYWTSNAGTSDMQERYPQADGRTHAFAYQLNQDLDRITADDLYPERYLINRTAPLRYRLIAVKPEILGDW